MLIVVHDGDIQFLLQAAFNFKTFGRFDVFQIHPAECGLECFHDAHEFVHIGAIDFKIEYIDIGEEFEENAFPFHYRFAGSRADIAETEYGGAVADYRHQVAFGGVFVHIIRCFGDAQARLGHTW